MTRVLQSMADGDVATLERLASPSAALRAIGTDPDEWWDGTTFLPVIVAQLAEMGDMKVEVLHVEGWEVGLVAWAAARVGVSVRDSEVEMRITAIFLLDAGIWRIVQWHASEGVPNEESLGFTLTTTLTEMLDSIDIDRDFATLPVEGMLTLMFTDVAGSTVHARELGDRAFTELMTSHIRLVSDFSDRSDGQVIKTVGDGTLVVFSSARAAVGCAVEIQRATETANVPYSIRIGLHAGDVVRTDSDVMGFAVNKAARVTSAAAGGQVVVSSVVKELVGFNTSFGFGDPFHAELRGIDGVHELVPVEWRTE